MMQRCYFCSTTWVDRAVIATGKRLTDLERRRLIAALLSRQHVILSGPAGIGKRRLAYELALSIVDGQQSRVCLLQGHPWWAARTGDVSYFVDLQTRFSMWKMAYFATSVLNGRPAFSQPTGNAGSYVVCVEQMSPVEMALHFRVVSESLFKNTRGKAAPAPIRLIGTYDSLTPPELDEPIARVAALVHLRSILDGDVKLPLAESHGSSGQQLD